MTTKNAQHSAWPVKIEYSKSRRQLAVQFDDGTLRIHTAEALRVHSPSAEVQGHSADQKKIVTGKENITITAIQPVGNYAVRLVFDDGHQTGLYTWDYLYKQAL